MKNILILLIGLFIPISGFTEESTVEIKQLLVKGIETYIKTNYVEAIELFKKVQEVDPKNELAEQYIQSSRQRLSEIEENPELALPKKVTGE